MIGVLGGGQLSRMLLQAAARLRMPALPAGASPDDPALQVSKHGSVLLPGQGAQADRAARERAWASFLARARVVVFENEFVDCDELERVALGADVRFLPSLAAIRILQDKLEQKQLLAHSAIPCAGHCAGPAGESDDAALGRWLDEVLRRFPAGAILKWAQYGYDGYGCFAFGATVDRAAALRFLRAGLAKGTRVFAERRIDFRCELAMTAVRAASGEAVTYPLVETEQEAGACKWVRGPAAGLGTAPSLEARAREILEAIGQRLGLVGAFTVEFFLDGEGRLLVNEIAPRVHNSAHYTLDAAAASQFENHLRAVTGMPLGSTATRPAFAMVNLLAPRATPGLERVRAVPLPAAPAGVQLHWYGKTGLKPGRKMGHVNWAGESIGDLDRGMRLLREADRAWSERVRAAASEAEAA